ncbi:MAG TPA: 30S ribosomal protein S13 [Anaerohalosphaeraceae bacterium]|nr:30S ribosomal protein S13 [Anaerohalosphaeraceae bacterium]HOL31097.1 30S ribosomal protein S13 [Anaerohalosphaeraceae bacterium]HOM77055.1 30S ribosomal protein S13 [Anaerohalosphaeraceae bacterium]HPC64671.1 30S ribosomal protein S13 [Anaerohalosphaeraceae bacterium]HPO69777.1 30S ribosomal protein S13 [Anaerohalosphaeraceae bacterium]
MPRIVGVDVPNNKPAWIALTYIHGIGVYTAKKILDEAGVDGAVRAGKLTEDEVSRITQIIDRDYEVEGALRRRVSQNIARLKDIACYRGIRHRRGLPVRGQQTQSNARTRKGKKKTVAGKKGVKELR